MAATFVVVGLMGGVLPVLGPPAGAATSPRWVSAGPVAGGVWSLTSPSTRLGTVFAVEAGFVVRSGDQGRTWHRASAGLQLGGVGTVAVQPHRPRHVLAGTGHGIYRSTDAGQTWQRVTTRFLRAREIAFLPGHPGTAIANDFSGDGSLLRTVDGGLHWRRVSDLLLAHLTVAPSLDGVVYAFNVPATRAFRSADGGRTWKALPRLPEGERPDAIAVDPSNGQVLYVSAGTPGTRVFKSRDGGRHWHPSDDGLEQYVLSLAVAPGNPRVLVAGTYPSGPDGDSLWISRDAGAHWHAVDSGHGAFRDLLIGQAGAVLAAGVTVLRGSIAPGAAWHESTMGMSDGRVRQLTADPVHPGTLWGVVEDDANYDLERAAVRIQARWTLVGDEEQNPGVVAPIADDPRSALVLWLYSCNDDFGFCSYLQRWTPQGPSSASSIRTRVDDVTGMVATSPTNSLLEYEGRTSGLYRSEDGGQSWVPLAEAPGSTTANAFALPRDDDQVVFVQTYEAVVRSQDRGDSWEPAGTGLPNHGRRGDLVATSVTTAFVAVNGVLYRTVDGAATWTALPGAGSEVQAIAADPSNPMRVFVGAGTHVHVSNDGGDTWEPTAPGLPGVPILSLAVGLGGAVHAGTDGYGVYDLAA